MDVEHDEVEVPLLQLNEGQVGHQGAAQEEEGVNSRESVEHSLAQRARVAEKQLKKIVKGKTFSVISFIY